MFSFFNFFALLSSSESKENGSSLSCVGDSRRLGDARVALEMRLNDAAPHFSAVAAARAGGRDSPRKTSSNVRSA